MVDNNRKRSLAQLISYIMVVIFSVMGLQAVDSAKDRVDTKATLISERNVALANGLTALQTQIRNLGAVPIVDQELIGQEGQQSIVGDMGIVGPPGPPGPMGPIGLSGERGPAGLPFLVDDPEPSSSEESQSPEPEPTSTPTARRSLSASPLASMSEPKESPSMEASQTPSPTPAASPTPCTHF